MKNQDKIIVPSGGPILYMDPTHLDIFGSCSDKYSFDENIKNFEDTLNNPEYKQLLERAMSKGLSPIEKDIFDLYYFKGLTQEEIGSILNLSQRTISYRLTQGVLRLKYYIFIDCIDFKMLRKDLLTQFPINHVNIVIGVINTSSQTIVGSLLGMNQSMIRWRFFKVMHSLNKLAKKDLKNSEKWSSYYQCLKTAVERFRIFSEAWEIDGKKLTGL